MNKKIKVVDNFNFKKKSKIKANDGLNEGIYPFYTSSAILNKYLNDYKIEEEALIFGTGGSASIHHSYGKFSTSTDCFVLQADSKYDIDLRYIYLYLNGNIYILENGFKGAGLKHISKKYIENIEIPLPPLQTQKEIVEVLDKAQELIDLRKKQIELLDDLIQSVFYDMFGDPVTNPMGWEVKKIGQQLQGIVAGWSVGGKERIKNSNEMAVLKISAVTSGVFNANEYKVVNADISDRVLVKLQKGDILFSRANTRELVAAACIVDKDYDDLFIPDKLWKIKIISSKLNNYWFNELLSNFNYRQILTKQASGTSGSMLNISKKKFENTIMPVPPIQLQNKFAQIVQKIESQKQLMQQSLTEMENNFNSLMQRAFKGELFPDEEVS